MKKIEIEDDLYKYILANIEDFGETPSQILRRLLSLPAVVDHNHSCAKVQDQVSAVSPSSVEQADPVVNENELSPSVCSTSGSSLPESVAHGVKALLADEGFKQERVVTNKFKMLLTTMYHENKEAFIAAANNTKGRKRNYLGKNLSALLASDNKAEVAQLRASKPRDIPHTPFWVITNANTGRKRIILTQMMASMGYPQHLIERVKDEI